MSQSLRIETAINSVDFQIMKQYDLFWQARAPVLITRSADDYGIMSYCRTPFDGNNARHKDDVLRHVDAMLQAGTDMSSGMVNDKASEITPQSPSELSFPGNVAIIFSMMSCKRPGRRCRHY